MSLEAVTLTGQHVRLESLDQNHHAELRKAADDERIWKHMLVDGRGAGFDKWFNDALTQKNDNTRLPFVVRQVSDGALVGSTSYLDPNLFHRRVEIGSTWYAPAVWGTAINGESKLLLLTHAFEVLKLNRVQFVTDSLNQRSQAAIAKLGALREGVNRSHMISQGGRIRDSVVFSIIASEWPQVKETLTKRLAGL